MVEAPKVEKKAEMTEKVQVVKTVKMVKTINRGSEIGEDCKS